MSITGILTSLRFDELLKVSCLYRLYNTCSDKCPCEDCDMLWQQPFINCAGRPLFHIGLHLLQKHNLIDILKLDILKVMKFLGESCSNSGVKFLSTK